MTLRLDAAVCKRNTFSFSLLHTGKKNLQRWRWTRRGQGAKKCHPVFWGYAWIISNALLQWSKSAAPVTNRGYKCFQESEAQLIPSAVNKVLEDWSLSMFVHFFALAEDERLLGILMNRVWMNIFLSMCLFTTAKTALQINIGTDKIREREGKTKRSKVWESNFASPNLQSPRRKSWLLTRAGVCNKLTNMFQISDWTQAFWNQCDLWKWLKRTAFNPCSCRTGGLVWIEVIFQ